MPSAKRLAPDSERRKTSRRAQLLAKARESRKIIEKLASTLGIDPATQLQKVLGKGKHLWKSNAEFEQFVHDIHEQRGQDRTS